MVHAGRFHPGAAAAWVALVIAGAAGCAEAPREGAGAPRPRFEVGPGKEYGSLQEVVGFLNPGDVVEVAGGATYPGGVYLGRSGTPEAPITIRGVGGARPVLAGGDDTVQIVASHVVLEGFEITQGAFRCVFVQGHEVTIRDAVIHDCPAHGVASADVHAGSLALEHVEIFHAGEGDTRHPVYVATDEARFPGAVFRMEHCYVHDGLGGNNVKSRAERNEIRYNWIEGAVHYEIELVGPEDQETSLAREDSDVVGNVFRKTGDGAVARLGGDGAGATWGRYRFASNTFLFSADGGTAFRLNDGLESFEAHNNVFWTPGGASGGVKVVRDEEALWVEDVPVIAGSGNWMSAGAAPVPPAWTGCLYGDDPGFSDASALDLRPAPSSALRDAGKEPTESAPGYAFPDPLPAPEYMPAPRRLLRPGEATRRPAAGPIDIGAYEGGGT